MSQENVRLVGQLYQAWNRRDATVGEDLVAPDIEVEILHGTDADGTHRGREDAFRAIMRFWGAFTDYRSEIEEAFPTGNHVFITAHHYARGRQSGVAVEMTNWQVFTVREGRVVRYGIYAARQQALEAAGLRE